MSPVWNAECLSLAKGIQTAQWLNSNQSQRGSYPQFQQPPLGIQGRRVFVFFRRGFKKRWCVRERLPPGAQWPQYLGALNAPWAVGGGVARMWGKLGATSSEDGPTRPFHPGLVPVGFIFKLPASCLSELFEASAPFTIW